MAHRVGSPLEASPDLTHRGMDDHSRRRRQNEPGMHANSSQRYSVGADPTQQRRSFAGGSSDRFRPSPINTSAAPRGMGAVSYSSYYQEPVAAFSTGMAQNSMPYQSDYSQDGRQTQGFGAYNPGMMYNVPQASTQNPVYDTSQQFQPRQPAALQMIAAEVPGPYFAGETTNPAAAAAAASGISGQQSSSNTPGASTVYQQSSATDRAALLQNYQQGSGMGHMSGISQSGSTDQVMDDQSQQTPQQQQQQQHQSSLNMNSVEEAYSDYQSELYEVFQSIESGSLANAGELLLRVSKWLLSKAVDLGTLVLIIIISPISGEFEAKELFERNTVRKKI